MGNSMKISTALGSALVDPVKSTGTVAQVPTPVVANKPAPGLHGPKGLSPRTTYSRVNTGAPPAPIAGMAAQKSIPPRGMEFLPAKVAHEETMEIHEKGNLQELLKAAMQGSIDKAGITYEAARQDSDEEEVDKTAEAAPEHYPTEFVVKLASAIGYLADMYKTAETGNVVVPGKGPQALQVLESNETAANIDAGESGQATSKNQPPKDPPTQPEKVQIGKANTGLETNDSDMKPEQPVDPMSNEKAPLASKTAESLFVSNLQRLGMVPAEKTAEKAEGPVALIREKLAEDAINPAKIQAGSDVPPAASASEEGSPPVPSDVSKQEKMVGSNQAAIDYTKREAKADPKSDVAKVLSEPPLTASTDKVLSTVLNHTEEAGAKISSAKLAGDSTRVAAARALLSNVLEKAAEAKKKKESQMSSGLGATASLPAQIPTSPFSQTNPRM